MATATEIMLQQMMDRAMLAQAVILANPPLVETPHGLRTYVRMPTTHTQGDKTMNFSKMQDATKRINDECIAQQCGENHAQHVVDAGLGELFRQTCDQFTAETKAMNVRLAEVEDAARIRCDKADVAARKSATMAADAYASAERAEQRAGEAKAHMDDAEDAAENAQASKEMAEEAAETEDAPLVPGVFRKWGNMIIKEPGQGHDVTFQGTPGRVGVIPSRVVVIPSHIEKLETSVREYAEMTRNQAATIREFRGTVNTQAGTIGEMQECIDGQDAEIAAVNGTIATRTKERDAARKQNRVMSAASYDTYQRARQAEQDLVKAKTALKGVMQANSQIAEGHARAWDRANKAERDLGTIRARNEVLAGGNLDLFARANKADIDLTEARKQRDGFAAAASNRDASLTEARKQRNELQREVQAQDNRLSKQNQVLLHLRSILLNGPRSPLTFDNARHALRNADVF